MDVRGARGDRPREHALAAAAGGALADLQRRSAAFPELKDDADWAILLALAEGHGGRPVTVGDACLASGAAATTAIRRIRTLEMVGAIHREDDPVDARRSLLRLTPPMERRLSRYFGCACEPAPKPVAPTILRRVS